MWTLGSFVSNDELREFYGETMRFLWLVTILGASAYQLNRVPRGERRRAVKDFLGPFRYLALALIVIWALTSLAVIGVTIYEMIMGMPA